MTEVATTGGRPRRTRSAARRARYFKAARKSSRYLGVLSDRRAERWRVEIRPNRKSLSLGLFTDERIAAATYERAARHYFGGDATLNFPGRRLEPADATTLRNEQARARKETTSSRYLGVYRRPQLVDQPWFASISVDGSSVYLGDLADGAGGRSSLRPSGTLLQTGGTQELPPRSAERRVSRGASGRGVPSKEAALVELLPGRLVRRTDRPILRGDRAPREETPSRLVR